MNKDNPRWPLYYSDTIHIGNLESNNAILCLWTKKERVIEKVNSKNYSFVGQLYSKEYGLQILVRNLLANPHIRNLVVAGIDLNESSEGIINLFEKGIDEENKVVGTEILLDDMIKKEHIDILRKRVKLHDFRDKKNFSELNDLLKNLNVEGDDGERIVIPLPKVRPPIRYPSDFSGYKARGKDLYEAYKKLVAYVLRFGVYNPETKKLSVPNITFFVKEFSEKDRKYLDSRNSDNKTTLECKKFNESHFTYVFDEVEVWDELKDLAKKVYFKKNVCFMISNAYIKESNLEDASEMIDDDHSLKWDPDPNGNIVIRLEHGGIKVMHVDQKGSVLDEFSGTTAKEIYRKIASENRISMLIHALDIGAELQKAEIALKEGKPYVQDKNR